MIFSRSNSLVNIFPRLRVKRYKFQIEIQSNRLLFSNDNKLSFTAVLKIVKDTNVWCKMLTYILIREFEHKHCICKSILRNEK